MSLATQMVSDMALFLSVDDFAVAATYQPQEASAGAFAITAVPGDGAPGLNSFPGGTGQDAPTIFAMQRSVVIAALTASLAAISAAARNPMRGDLITIAAGQQAGTYVVETWQSDIGDGLMISAVRSDQQTLGADQARRI